MEPRANSDAVPIIPERLCTEVTKFLPEDAVLAVDTGHAGIWTGSMVDMNHPGQDYIRCAGSLGWGLPGAIGAKLALPDRPVVCFTGDGGFWYHIAEMETAVRYSIPLVVVINNNSGLIQDKRGDDAAYALVPGSDSADLWWFTDVDLAKVSEAMGAFAVRVEQPDDIQPALQQALASGRPAVVDVVTDQMDSLGSGALEPVASAEFSATRCIRRADNVRLGRQDSHSNGSGRTPRHRPGYSHPPGPGGSRCRCDRRPSEPGRHQG